MDWWQAGSVIATLFATAVAVATFGWRVTQKVRQENRDAHDRIGIRIDKMGSEVGSLETGLGARIDKVEAGLGARIDKVAGGLVHLREGLGEVRGELRGVTRSLNALQKDFRAHVLGGGSRPR